jgi:hypothetical protein
MAPEDVESSKGEEDPNEELYQIISHRPVIQRILARVRIDPKIHTLRAYVIVLCLGAGWWLLRLGIIVFVFILFLEYVLK